MCCACHIARRDSREAMTIREGGVSCSCKVQSSVEEVRKSMILAAPGTKPASRKPRRKVRALDCTQATAKPIMLSTRSSVNTVSSQSPDASQHASKLSASRAKPFRLNQSTKNGSQKLDYISYYKNQYRDVEYRIINKQL